MSNNAKDQFMKELDEIRKKFKELEEKTENTEKQKYMFEETLEILHIGVTIADPTGKIVFTNPAEAKLHGYSREELIGKDVGIFAADEFRNPMDISQIAKLHRRIRETYNMKKDGSTFPVQLVSDVIKDESGEPLGIVTASENISGKKRLEQEIQESNGKFNRLMEISPLAILIYNFDDGILEVNEAARELLGYSEQKILNMDFTEIVAPTSQEEFTQNSKALIKEQGVAERYEVKIITAHGEEKWAEFSTGLVQVEDKPAIIAMLIEVDKE